MRIPVEVVVVLASVVYTAVVAYGLAPLLGGKVEAFAAGVAAGGFWLLFLDSVRERLT